MKTQGTIKIDIRKSPAELPDLLRLIFRSPTYQIRAEKILRLIKEGRITAENYSEIIHNTGMTPSSYYHIIRRLRSLGMIEKSRGYHKGIYTLSRRFSNRLRDIARFWELWAFER